MINEEVLGAHRSRFVFGPLEPEVGYTLGNSLRRVLLSSIPGAAVTSVRIETVLHEFSTVEGMTEDVTEILQNLKDLVVSSVHDEPVTMYLRKSGAGAVTAADIAPPAGVEVHTPDQVIATLNDRARFEMELVVERGRGYVSAAQNKTDAASIGRLWVDSIYSPVAKVTYRVETVRVEDNTEFEQLVLDVETKPSIRPRDAVASAGTTLVALFGLAAELNQPRDTGPDWAAHFADGLSSSADFGLPIEDLQLSVRSYNCLKRTGISTVGDLIERSADDLRDIRNFGEKSVVEIEEKMRELGLSLRDPSRR